MGDRDGTVLTVALGRRLAVILVVAAHLPLTPEHLREAPYMGALLPCSACWH